MIELGKMQTLEVKNITSVGVFLNTKDNQKKYKDVLLPKKEVPKGTKVGDEIEVFIYRDFKERIITTRRPR